MKAILILIIFTSVIISQEEMYNREISLYVINAGNYSVDFSGKNLSAGTYFYELKAGSFREVKKMLLLK